MKKLTPLYVSLVILIVVIIISIWITRENVEIQPVSQKISLEKEAIQKQNRVISDRKQYPAIPKDKKPVAIIKKKSVKKKVASEATKKEVIPEQGRYSEESSSSSKQSLSISDKATAGETYDTVVPSVTKIKKRPTAKESNDMNARGIIMY